MKKLIFTRHSLRAAGLVFTLIIFSLSFSFAQTTPTAPAPDTAGIKKDTSWKRGGFVSVTFAQAGFNNWAQGGENSLSLNGLFNGFYNYHTPKTIWENSLTIAYGLNKLDGGVLEKSDDRIEFTSVFSKKATGKFFYSLLLGFKTQFTPGYNYPNDSTKISDFMAPGYVALALGVTYQPADYFSVLLSPATGKLTIVANQAIADSGTYGNQRAVLDTAGNVITHGKEIRFQFGASLAAKFQKDIVKNVNLLAKLGLFDDYTNPIAANRGNIAVNFEGLLTMKVNKFLSASVACNFIYDNDILVPFYQTGSDGVVHKIGSGPRLQSKDIISVGFAYKLNQKK